jgi:hypothetical protein
MKRLVVVLTVAGVLLSPALCTALRAQDAGGEKPKAERPHGGDMNRPALTDMTVTGKVTKEEKQIPAREGHEAKTVVTYVLTDAAGNKVMLSEGGRHDSKPGEGSIKVNWADYLDKDVTVVGKGFQRERDGKKYTRLVVITKVDAAVAAPAAAAPAAPAPAK